ncbi:AAA family ATPase [Candidatus Micrarchaeota archaeon]|nr:AAA family ATPase [Candidatus Micrarchaeota archaeon]
MNLFKSIENKETIFKNESVFNQGYIPEDILHRESHLKEMAFALKNIAKGKKPSNIFLYGPPGTGKTTCAKYVVNELSEYTDKAVGTYINCWHYSTRYSVLNQISYSVDPLTPRRGLAPDELIERIISEIKKTGKIPVVILDEVDVLAGKGEEGLLYDLLRLDQNEQINIAVISITNDDSFMAGLDRRIKSSFAQKSLKFMPYRPAELKDIVMERSREGLLPTTYDDEIIGKCSGFGAKNQGDARIAIQLLYLSAKEADREGKNKIEVVDVETAKKFVVNEIRKEKEKLLQPTEKKIFDELGFEWVKASDVYSKLEIQERTGRYCLNKLENLGLVETRMDSGKRGGREARRKE